MTDTEHTKWIVDVPVATIWTDKNSPRKIDEPGISNPLNIHEWYETLNFDLRKNLNADNRVQTQALYGEEVIIDDADGDWVKVIAIKQASSKDERGYPGWMPNSQIKPVEADLWDQSQIAVVTKKTALLLNEMEEELLELPYLTVLPIVKMDDIKVKVMTPTGEAWLYKKDVRVTDSIESIPKGSGEQIVDSAKQFLGLDYFWGGMSAYGFDCSGFTYNMHKAHGYLIPRDARDQATQGIRVSFEDLQMGDLLFFSEKGEDGPIDHVGIYYGDGKMIHAAMTERGVEISPIKQSDYGKKFVSARRYHV